MTIAKRVAVSADGIAWYTLPGSSGEWNDEAEQVNDTIFGATFSSTQPGLITWTSNAQAYYKGFAGYVASIKAAGTSVVMTAAAMAQIGATKVYAVVDRTKEIWDYTKTLTVADGGTPVNPTNIKTLDYLFGRVEFVASYTPSGPVTVTGSFLPMSEVSRANSFTLTQTAETVDHTDYQIAHANDGYRVFRPGLRTISLELGGFYDATDAVWEVLEQRKEIVIEINPDGSGMSLARGIFKLVSRNQSGDVGALEEQTRTFNLSVREGMDVIFNWVHDVDTTLSPAVRVLLDAYINQQLPYVRYEPDGPEELLFQGQAVLTDVSLSSSLDAMNEFTAAFQGSDQPTRGGISS